MQEQLWIVSAILNTLFLMHQLTSFQTSYAPFSSDQYEWLHNEDKEQEMYFPFMNMGSLTVKSKQSHTNNF